MSSNASTAPSSSSTTAVTSFLRRLDTNSVNEKAQQESRNREVHLPPISTYRWWARRTEAVNGALLDAYSEEFGKASIQVADPFAGGGIIPLAAAMRGHQVYAQDLNPWAAEGLAAMFALPSPTRLREGAKELREYCADLLSEAYTTEFSDGRRAEISHTFRVASAKCSGCGKRERLFPYAMMSLLKRKERGETDAFLACPNGHLFHGDIEGPQDCPECGVTTDPEVKYTGRRYITCNHCDHREKLERRAQDGTWKWEVVLVERGAGRDRELDIPTAEERKKAKITQWEPSADLGPIPEGKETRVLLRHGFTSWNDLYPARQRYVMEHLLEACSEISADPEVSEALRIGILGVAEMAGHCSRWDRWYLKSYEAMASHRFNFTTFTAEPNVWGAKAAGRGTFRRRLRQLERGAEWIREEVSSSFQVEGPLSTKHHAPNGEEQASDVRVVQGSSESILLPDDSVELVLTDPPYHDDVQYGELSLPFRAWAGQSTDELAGEAVVNGVTEQQENYDNYRTLLRKIFSESRRVLDPGGHLVFSYANRNPAAWTDVLSALQDAGFRAAGYAVLHSENEQDQSKRNVRACTMDFIMDVAPDELEVDELWTPALDGNNDEEAYLEVIAKFFLQLGQLQEGWEEQLEEELNDCAFL